MAHSACMHSSCSSFETSSDNFMSSIKILVRHPVVASITAVCVYMSKSGYKKRKIQIRTIKNVYFLRVLFIVLHQWIDGIFQIYIRLNAISKLKAGETSENTPCNCPVPLCTIPSFPIPAMSQAFEERCSGALSVLRTAEPSASGLQRR